MSDFKNFASQTLKWTAIGSVCMGIAAGGAFLLNVATQPLRLTINTNVQGSK